MWGLPHKGTRPAFVCTPRTRGWVGQGRDFRRYFGVRPRVSADPARGVDPRGKPAAALRPECGSKPKEKDGGPRDPTAREDAARRERTGDANIGGNSPNFTAFHKNHILLRALPPSC